MSETETTTLKLLIDSKANKVVFAEADKAFVDFICDILRMPMNSIIKLLIKDNDNGMVGTLGNVYKSIEALGNEHMHSNVDSVLKPTTTIYVPLLSVFHPPHYEGLKLYGCTKHSFYSDVPGLRCTMYMPYPYLYCNEVFRPLEWEYVVTPDAQKLTTARYVKGVGKYMIMDNLEVKPLSMALITSHLNSISSLIEKDVEVGPNEGVAILKASLETQSVLTAVFLGKKVKTEK